MGAAEERAPGGIGLEGIRAVIEAKKRVHPELRRRLGWHGLQRILAREGVALRVMALPDPAQLVSYRGRWTILLNADLPTRRHMWAVAHEIGHLWLHHDHTCERWERVYHLEHEEGPDPREDDAEIFAACLLGGPRWF